MKRLATLTAAFAAALFPALSPGQSLQFGNLNVVQHSFGNNANEITLSSAPGGTAGWTIDAAASNRGDYVLRFGNASDPAAGVLISSVRENGRDDSATGNTLTVPFFATSATSSDETGYYLSLFHASNGAEVNTNLSFGFFPYASYLGGYATNPSNNTALNRVVGSAGIQVGTTLKNSGTGQYLLDLTSLGGPSSAGVLLVTGAKNEDNFALSRPNADGTFTIFCKDNDANGTSYEADPVAFVYLPVSSVGHNQLAAIGRINSDGSSDVAAGAFSVSKGGVGQWYLTIHGHSEATGTLLVSPEWGGLASGDAGAMLDNIVTAQWDAANNRWVVERRDITNTTTLPALEDGAEPAEDVFSFAFLTNGPINQPPSASVTAPAAASHVAQGAPFTFSATASDSDGAVAKVVFYDGATVLGEDDSAPYAISVNSLELGAHSLVARAIDNGGAVGMSAPVSLTVDPAAGTGGLFFDGVNDYVTFGNAPALGLKSFTLECWFKREGAGSGASSGSGGVTVVPLISKGRGENDGSNVDCNYLLGIEVSSGKLAADFEDFATGLNHPVRGTTVIPTGAWQHAAATFDATTFEWRLYLNGSLEAVVSTNGQIPRYDSIQHAAIAAALNSTGAPAGAFFGWMDEVRIWNYARSQQEIQEAINSPVVSANGLVARWGMDEGTGTKLASTAGSTLDGTLTNGPVWTGGSSFDAQLAPIVTLTAPADGSSLPAPASFTLQASANDPDGSVTSVEFFRDGESIGTDNSAPFALDEAGLAAGVYRYTARATDNQGLSALSAAVTVTVPFDPAHPPANTALRFDGVDDYVTMGAAPELGLGGPPNNSFTAEGWFRREGAGIASNSGSGGVAGVPLFGKGRGESDGSVVDCDYFFGIDADGHLVADFETYPGPGLSAGQNYPVTGHNTPITTGVWHHAAVTYDGSTATWHLYLDGTEVGTATAAPGALPRYDSTQHFALATAMDSSGTPAGAFAGRLDEVRLWNYARSAEQIAESMHREISSAPGLVARYGLNESSGTTVHNATDLGGDPLGTVVGNPMWAAGAPFTSENAAPTVALTTPQPGASTMYPYGYALSAVAGDPDGSVARVEFYVDGEKVGEDDTAPYAATWTPPSVGTFSIVARSVDALGAVGVSEPVTLTVIPNTNQPGTVGSVSPASDAQGVGASVALQVQVSDPENDGATVTFYGRKTVPPVPGPDFTLVTLPDTQYYSENNGGTRFRQYLDQTRWIVEQRDTRNIAFVSHMGDIVDDGDSIPQEWVNANQAMSVLEDHAATLRAYGIPFGAAPGNHDQSTNGNAESPSFYYNQYFGVSRYEGRPYWGGHYGDNNDNNYQLFSASGLDFIILHLEYRTSADPAVIAWADSVLKAYPHRRAIVTSHWIIGQGNPASFGGQGQQILDGLKNNPNLFLLLCGHIHAEGRRSDVYQGRTIYSVLQDYQGAPNGGNGFLRYYVFSPATNTITTRSYSPTLGREVTAADAIPGFQGAFTLAYDMQSPVSGWIPLGTATLKPGETAATITWTGLEPDSHYEWYAEAFDGINRANGPTRRFSTASSTAPTITLTAPSDGVTYTAPANVTLKADAADADGSVVRVDFFEGTRKVGSASAAPFTITSPGVLAGSYAYSAVAVDDGGHVKLSNIATATVADRVGSSPTVSLTSPVSGDAIAVPGSVALNAAAADPDGVVSSVAFYADGELLGTDETAPYSWSWSPAAPGAHTLTAVATDNDGNRTTSAGVAVNASFTPAAAAADADGDLVPQLMEYALGLTDTAPNRRGMPSLAPAGQGGLAFTFRRAQAGLVYTVQGSDDLETWSDLAVDPGSVGAEVTVTDSSGSSNRFLRLRVSDGASSATTVPVGRITCTFTGGRDNAFSVPLLLPIGEIVGHPAGFISSVGASTLDDATAGWAPGALSQGHAPYLLRITRGAAAGRVFPVSTEPAGANTASRLTLVTHGADLTQLGIVPGVDTYELVPADTLASLFPAGALQSGTTSTADLLRAWTGTAWTAFRHDGTQWVSQTGEPADDLVVPPDRGWMLARRGATLQHVMLGTVPSVAASVDIVRPGMNFVSLLPLRRRFADAGLEKLPGWTSNPSNPTSGDHVRLWSGTAWLNYYYDGSRWLRQGAGDASATVVLEPGRPVFIVRPSGSGRDTLRQNATY